MGAQVLPENQIPPIEEPVIDPPVSSDPPPTPTPPTPSPAAPLTDRSEYIKALEAQLREQNRIIQEQQDAASRPASATPSSAPAATDRNSFFEDPHAATRSIVAAELDRVAKPLNDALQRLANAGQPDTLKERFRHDPMYSQYFAHPQFSAAVDLVMNTVDKTESNYRAALNQAVGWYHTNQLSQVLGYPVTSNPAPSVNNQPAPSVNNNPAPPYVAPSAPPPPRPTAPKVRQLTELEKRLARENNMTDLEYVAWLTESGNNVVGSKIGRTP